MLGLAAGFYGMLIVWAVIVTGVGACSRKPETGPSSRVRLPSQASAQTSESCRECHGDLFAAWERTDHARANQPIGRSEISDAFEPAREEADGGSRFHVRRGADGKPEMAGRSVDGREEVYAVEAVLGSQPLRQMLVPQAGGRWQPVDLAWDPARRDWFNVFADEHRHAGEWGHWTGRGMNWNSMCAHCHMTGYRKNYDAASDSYRSTWVEHGVGCIQCHGPMPEGHGRGDRPRTGDTDPASWTRDRHRAMDTCAYCHARQENLTAEFSPGDAYHDHFRLTLPSQPGAFWPDGQQRDEVFTWTSMTLSRMHHAGVTCMDCHDPHTTKTILPVENNALCMQCHAAPGRRMPTTGALAPVIDPTRHSRHAENSAGNQCVSCHMPTTHYMVRAARHDHGWLKPDPLLTRELGIPNACNRCHTDQTVDWAIEHASAWYGDRLDSRQRSRARVVAAAHAREPAATDRLLELFATEDIPAWRATYLQLLSASIERADVIAAARRALNDADPQVRASAVQLLGGDETNAAGLRPFLHDPSRRVRLDAAWALPRDVPTGSSLEREFLEYLEVAIDQPTGRVRRGQYLANLGRLPEAERELRTAAAWDPRSAGIHEMHALVLQALGQTANAAQTWRRAAALEPRNGEFLFRAALGFAEAGQLEEAETALRGAVQRQPEMHRAWYNLGLLLAQAGRRSEALDALARAESLAPDVPDYPYAAATLYWQNGERDTARSAARRALAADPHHPPSLRLLRQP
jgi:predicted CXXCH cytochrome family protein